MAELRAARDAAVAPLVELRLDGVEAVDVAGALHGRRVPVVVTCRPTWEGGFFDGSEVERLALLADAVRLGAEYVDLEWRADRGRFSSTGRTAIVLSHHDFSGMPTDLEGRLRAMAAEQPAVVKVAVTPGRLLDCLRLRDATSNVGRHVAIAMGRYGQVTRLCPARFDSCWTYGGANAPGQVSARELIEVYRVPASSAASALYGITGAPLAHSASPAMHNAAFAALGMDAVYVPLETDDAAELLEVAEALGVSGVSVTAPLKTACYQRVPAADDLSRATGAVNTLRRCDGGWEARNFDAHGFLAPLERRRSPFAGRRAVVLGAGGSARTVTWALAHAGARVEVTSRRPEQADEVARRFGAAAVSWPPAPGWDLLVNTTPVGTWPNVEASPLDRHLVAGRLVYDLIYNPEETTLLRWAREAGAETIGGLEMLVAQAACQFEWWTGQAAPSDVMLRAARSFISHRHETP